VRQYATVSDGNHALVCKKGIIVPKSGGLPKARKISSEGYVSDSGMGLSADNGNIVEARTWRMGWGKD
jgi:hypothetical protein